MRSGPPCMESVTCVKRKTGKCKQNGSIVVQCDEENENGACDQVDCVKSLEYTASNRFPGKEREDKYCNRSDKTEKNLPFLLNSSIAPNGLPSTKMNDKEFFMSFLFFEIFLNCKK